MTTTLIFVRHAPTFENEQHIMIGRTNPRLHEPGMQMARRVALALCGTRIDAIVASPLHRAHETAIEIAKMHRGASIQIVQDLQELDLGIVDGVSSFDAYEQYKELFDTALLPTTSDFAFPKGELWSHAATRIERVVEDSVQQYAGKTICLVTHGGLLGLWRCQQEGLSLGAFRQMQPKHASFSVAMNFDKKMQIIRWNDTTHLIT